MRMSEDNIKEDSKINELSARKENLLALVKKKKQLWVYAIMAVIAWFGYYIRTRNVPLLQGKWLPDVDSYAFLRYAEYIAEHGKLMANDVLRYYPFGFDPRGEFGILSYCIAYLYKLMHAFNSSVTVVDAAILYPALSFFIAAIFCFLFVKKLFNYKVAIISTAFLAVTPAFLYRTMAGVADKEALAVALMFATLYFYVLAFKSEKPSRGIIFGITAGILNALMAAVWGGYIFIMLAIAIHAIICTILGIFKKNQFYTYGAWMITLMIFAYMLYPVRFPLQTFLSSLTSQIMIIGFLMSGIAIIMHHKKLERYKQKIEAKLPLGIFALLATFGIGIIFLFIWQGHSVFEDVLRELYITITRPFATTRWQMTVAENHQPYFTDWIGQFSWTYLLLSFAGAGLLFYNIINKVKMQKITKWYLTIGSMLFIATFSMSRYSQSSTFNGETGISQLLYIGSLVLFVGCLGYGYVKYIYKDNEANKSIENINSSGIMIFVWLVIMIIAARSAIRLLFVFAPITAILTGYLASESFDWCRKLKKDVYKIVGILLIAVVIIATFNSLSKTVLAQAKYVGPSFTPQWQNAMSWAKENTPQDAVFAHWWDYGYWVQWGANRATIVDGGNAMGSVNYFVGRHILTGQNETEALKFMKSRNVTDLLIISDEIGKYPAYSSIGADRNYDRYSWISTYSMQQDQTRETRNSTVYLYTGGTPMDDDFVYKGQLFPAGSAGVAGFFLPVQNMEISSGNDTTTIQRVLQPEAVIVYNGQQVKVPLRCAYINGQEMVFSEKESLEGCLRVMPTIEGNGAVNPLGAALYLSPEVYSGMFAKIYLLNKEYPHIKLAYSDENTGMPLAIYQGRMIGPLKIWSITYPDNLEVPPEYYLPTLPDPELDKIKK